jgi:hypothetical protein
MRHDIQHDDIKHNDTQPKGLQRETLSKKVTESNNSAIMLSVTFYLCGTDYHYAEGRCAECHYAECRGAEADPIKLFCRSFSHSFS